MSGKRVVLRDLAGNDIEQAIEHYLTEAGTSVALAFIDALEASLRQIGEQPGSGSPRHAHELDIPGLRSLSTPDFRTLSSTLRRSRKSMCGEFCTERETFLPGCESYARTDLICIAEDGVKRRGDWMPIGSTTH